MHRPSAVQADGNWGRMYFAVVILLMFALPVGSVIAEHQHAATALVPLVGKWFVFWSVGVRLTLAGLRQYVQPGFTSKEIFGIASSDAFPLVRELGIANFATGMVGILSMLKPDFVLPVAISATLFYGIAGTRHTLQGHRNAKETMAMASDLFVAIVLGCYTVLTLQG
jgi:hypothetical protein